MVVVTRSDEYIEHHGILKQKWGVRHGPPYPLDYDDHSRAQKKANPKSDLNNYEGHNEKTEPSESTSSSSSSNTSSASESTKKVEVSEKKETSTAEKVTNSTKSAASDKEKSSKEKVADKETEKEERKSLHDRRKEALMAKGLTEEQAENQIKFENRAMAIAAVTAVAIGAGVTYGLVRQHNMDSDFLLKGGTEMFRVSTNEDASVQDMFYATTNKADSRKYAGMYAKQLNGELFGQANGKDVYQKMLSPKSDVRVAGAKTGERIFNELKKDPNFFRQAHGLALEGVDDWNDKMISRVAQNWSYDEFNRHTLMQQKNSGAAKMFFNALQKEGYGGVIDINDAKYSGYEANKPVILFNQKSNINVNSVNKLSKETINSNFNFARKRILAQNFMAQSYTTTVAELGAGAFMMAGKSYLKNLDMESMPVPQETNTKKKK